MSKFKSYIELLDSNVWNYVFFVPDSVIETLNFEKGKAKRVLCKVNNNVVWHAGILSNGENRWFITVNKQNIKRLGVNKDDEIEVELEPDNSKYGMEVAEEFMELLRQDPEGSDVFHSLTPGKQRNLIYIVNQPRSSEIRLSKAICILEYLKDTGGKINFRELNEALKNRNF